MLKQIGLQQQEQNANDIVFNGVIFVPYAIQFDQDFDKKTGRFERNPFDGLEIDINKDGNYVIHVVPASIIKSNDISEHRESSDHFTKNGTNPFKTGINANYVENYFGTGANIYSEKFYTSKIGENPSIREEFQYNKYVIYDKTELEIYSEFTVKGNGEFGDRDTQVISNQIIIYDLKKQNVLEITLEEAGTTHKIREMTEEEKTDIPAKVKGLRKEIDEKYKATPEFRALQPQPETIYEQKNSFGAIDLYTPLKPKDFHNKVNEMMQGYDPKFQNKGEYVISGQTTEKQIC